jgi:hypothetical protein
VSQDLINVVGGMKGCGGMHANYSGIVAQILTRVLLGYQVLRLIHSQGLKTVKPIRWVLYCSLRLLPGFKPCEAPCMSAFTIVLFCYCPQFTRAQTCEAPSHGCLWWSVRPLSGACYPNKGPSPSAISAPC